MGSSLRVVVFALCGALSACVVTPGAPTGSGAEGEGRSPSGPPSLLTALTEVASLDDCPDGGFIFDHGFDVNGDGVLGAEEVQGSNVVCHGKEGPAGPNGEPGADGAAGPSGTPGAQGPNGEPGAQGPSGEQGAAGSTTLLIVAPEPPNPQAIDGVDGCLHGGSRIVAGLDDGQDVEGRAAGVAGDGRLDAGEVDAVTYVCHGPPGEQGEQGAQGEAGGHGEAGERGEAGARGEAGERGQAGEPGAAGPASLIRIERVAATPDAQDGVDGCVAGGVEVLAGLDDGLDAQGDPAGQAADGVLDDGEVDARALLCDGPRGDDGDDGDDGPACVVTDNGDGTVTIACGDEAPVTFAVPHCGNGIVEAGEPCDDGNDDDTDDCTSDCAAATCGDGHVFAGVESREECDDGDIVDNNDCTNDCRLPRCGDGILQAGEGCDDGNADTEACDYGQQACTVCDDSCAEVAGTTSFCGDGEVNGDEECDDGNLQADDGCAVECTFDLPGECRTAQLSGAHFFVCETLQTADDAEDICGLLPGGTLATVRSPDETRAIDEECGPPRSEYWIGLRRGEGGFGWVSGVPLRYTNWMVGGQDGGDCVRKIFADNHPLGRWNDTSCHHEMGFVCEVRQSCLVSLGQKRTSQSSTQAGWVASLGVDGDIETYSQSEAEFDEWWQVDLGDVEPLRVVRVWPRPDAPVNTQSYDVLVSNDGEDWRLFAEQRGQAEFPSEFRGADEARFVRLQRQGDPHRLSVAELEIEVADCPQ